jgi:hypothetical protein
MMNELIKQLEKQCWDNQTNHLDTEKFAELIIAECVDIADDYVKDYLVEEHIKFNHPRSKIGLKIKEHFGVENKENT